MKAITRPAVAALLLLALATATVAQQKRQAPAKPQPKPAAAPAPPPTFETLIPAESYVIYGEVRGVGQLIRSNAINDALEPILKLAAPPKELKSVLKWLNAYADDVMTSRLLVATWPVAKDMPEAIVAIEFASAEEATKFASPLNKILTTVLPPVTEPSPETQGENPRPAPPPKPSYHLQQAGSLVLLTAKPLELKKLKPAGSKRLAEDINFRAARNRFNSEPLFVFVDVKLMERQDEARRKQYEEEQRKQAEQITKEQAAAAEQAKEWEEPPLEPPVEERVQEPVLDQATASVKAEVEPPPDPVSSILTSLASPFFSRESKWPEGIGLALTFENDSFDLRALFVSQPGEKSDVVPFMPMLIPGPAVVPESPNILPADTELFVTMSLDLEQIYAEISKPRENPMFVSSSRTNARNLHLLETVHESPFAALEKRLKMNLKDDVLPLLGSEITLRLPLTGLSAVGLPTEPAAQPVNKENQPKAGASPVLLISLRDKEAVRALMPKIVDALGFKGASSFAQTERKEDTELVSYINFLSYAFVGNFLVLSGDPGTVRHVVDSYLKNETLAGDSPFKNFTRWQPRPAQGQLYISPALMEGYKTWARDTKQVSDETRAFLTRLAAVAYPITYSLSNEGLGPLHELHVPKNLVLMAVAGISGVTNRSPEDRKQEMVRAALLSVAFLQEEYKKDKGSGSYGTLEQLIPAYPHLKDLTENSGYKFEVFVIGDKFEVFAAPVEYGKGGKMSYFIDQTRVLRGADHNGASASSSDPPIN